MNIAIVLLDAIADGLRSRGLEPGRSRDRLGEYAMIGFGADRESDGGLFDHWILCRVLVDQRLHLWRADDTTGGSWAEIAKLDLSDPGSMDRLEELLQ